MPVSTPVITSNGGGDTASITINEGLTAVTTVTAFDQDNAITTVDTLTYKIVGGADQFKFHIDPVTGALTFIAAPDFEAPTDSTKDHLSVVNGLNSYEVMVEVFDGPQAQSDTLHDIQTITVNIANVNPVTITGTSGADLIDATHTVSGQSGPTVEGDTINAGGGDDSINGAGGFDIMSGGLGNDTYYVNDGKLVGAIGSQVWTTDTVIENSGEGTDTVHSSVDHYTLTANVENLILDTGAVAGTGNSGNNTITGNLGANTIDGGGGTDTMAGGLGADTYITDGGDTITENIGEGTDTVQSTVSYTLGANLENLTLLEAGGAINGTGNELNNVITGNTGVNTLTGNDGNDTLDGGGGSDTLVGGAGNDTYIVNNTGVTVTEVTSILVNGVAVSQGTDTVISSVNFTLGAGLENLTLTTSPVDHLAHAINGTGNALNNTMIGNAAINTLNGGGGSDILDGKAGNDVMIGSTGNDTY